MNALTETEDAWQTATKYAEIMTTTIAQNGVKQHHVHTAKSAPAAYAFNSVIHSSNYTPLSYKAYIEQ